MAKAILEFDLNDHDDAMAHLRAVKSLNMALVLWEMAYNTKKSICFEIEKKERDGETVSPYDAISMFYNRFWEEMNDRNINPEELIR